MHIEGKPVRSCLLPVGAVRDRAVTTIEGVGSSPAGAKVQKALARPRGDSVRLLSVRPDHGGRGAVGGTPMPDDSDIDAAMAGNICRCGTYVGIRAAIKQAATGRQSSKGRHAMTMTSMMPLSSACRTLVTGGLTTGFLFAVFISPLRRSQRTGAAARCEKGQVCTQRVYPHR